MSILSSLSGRHEGTRPERLPQVGFLRSQVVLFNSRRRWGFLYSLATLAGIFVVPGVSSAMGADDLGRLLLNAAALPVITLLIATGMYILNDLVDADLDRANGKKRPVPSGMVSKNQALFFVVSTNGLAVLLSALTRNSTTLWIVAAMLCIGIMYSAPRVALMNRFMIKTLSISIFYSICALLGITSIYGMALFLEEPAMPLYSMALLGIMIFVSSTLNDLGDVDGDRAAGRKTIPVVIGGPSTMKLLSLLSLGMAAISIAAIDYVGVVCVIMATVYAVIVISRLGKIHEGITKMDAQAVRLQHKKFLPLHIVLQLILTFAAVATM